MITTVAASIFVCVKVAATELLLTYKHPSINYYYLNHTQATYSKQEYSRHAQNTMLLQVACRVYFMTSYIGSTFLNESSTSSLSWFAGVCRTKLQST